MLENLKKLFWEFARGERGGTGTAVATDDIITAAKMNLKLEEVAGTDLATADYVSRVFTANAFQYPAPGTDWTPQLEGAHLAASKTTKKCWLPLNFLKIGDVITSYKLVGDAVETTALTLDCKLVRVNKADPLTTTDITNGDIAQVVADGNFDVEADNDDETVATDKQYLLEILGTTDTGDTITVIGAEVTITRKL